MINSALLFSNYSDKLSYYDDWLDAISGFKYFCVDKYNISDDLDVKKLKNTIKEYEIIILHHSTNADGINDLEHMISLLNDRKGKLCCFIGNEVNLPISPISSRISFLKKVEADLIISQLLPEACEWLYEDIHNANILSLPHALNQKAFIPGLPIKYRKIDLGVRSAKYNIYIGDSERVSLITYFANNAEVLGLTVDISIGEDNKRFDRKGWARFLQCCKGTIATEAGSFYLEKDDNTVNEIQKYLMQKNHKKFIISRNSKLRALFSRFIPKTIKYAMVKLLKGKLVEDYNLGQNANIEEIEEKYFSKIKKSPVYSKAISSRHFEAAGSKCVQIMFPGRYNDILLENKHYISLYQDFSNIDEVIEKFNDISFCQKMCDDTYDYIITNHTYEHRMYQLAQTIQNIY